MKSFSFDFSAKVIKTSSAKYTFRIELSEHEKKFTFLDYSSESSKLKAWIKQTFFLYEGNLFPLDGFLTLSPVLVKTNDAYSKENNR